MIARRPILFLDCDGVLNTVNTPRKERDPRRRAWRYYVHVSEPALVERLRRFAEEFNLIIVVSSTWRKLNTRGQFISYLGEWLQPHIPRSKHWRTGNGRTGFRGVEVEQWFADNKAHQGTPYVIFDDDGDFHWHQPLVNINYETGLTDENIARARAILTYGKGF